MKAKIISRNELFRKSMTRYLEKTCPDVEFEHLILVDTLTVLGDSRQSIEGVGPSVVRDYVADPQNIIILMSIESEAFLMKYNQEFAGFMNFPNVDYVDATKLNDIFPIYQRLVGGSKKINNTGYEIYKFQQRQKKIAVLRHDLDNAQRDGGAAWPARDLLADWLRRARTAGLTGSDEEIVHYVKEWRPETSGEFSGKLMEGIFVDAYETLFDEDWHLNLIVHEAVGKLAQTEQKYVFVISDSESSPLEKRLAENGITWPLLSKFDLAGAVLEIVIDNITGDDFVKDYGILFKKFIPVIELL